MPAPNQLKNLKTEIKQVLIEFFIRKLPLVFLSLSLFLGGIFLLSLRIPGWGLVLGLPSTLIGIVFLIFSFDEVAQTKVGPDSFRIVFCESCGKPTLAFFWEERKICQSCYWKTSKKLGNRALF